MSKLVERLKSLDREATPMGFRATGQPGQKPPLLLIAKVGTLPVDSSTFLTGAMAGLDAAFVPGTGLSVEALEWFGRAVPGLPLGFSSQGMTTTAFDSLAGAGADFVVFDLKAPIPVLDTEKLGRFLELTWDTDTSRVMTAGELAPVIDGVVITTSADIAVTIEYLLVCRRAVRLFGLPVLAEVPASVTATDLRCLREAGVDGVVISNIEAITSIKKAIESLPKGIRRQWAKRPRPILPKPGEGAAPTLEED